MGTQPVHHITNLQTMCPANFRIWLTFDHNNIGHNHQQNSTAPKRVYPIYPAFTKRHQCKVQSYYMTRLAFHYGIKTFSKIIYQYNQSRNKKNQLYNSETRCVEITSYSVYTITRLLRQPVVQQYIRSRIVKPVVLSNNESFSKSFSVNPAFDRFPTPLSQEVIRLVIL